MYTSYLLSVSHIHYYFVRSTYLIVLASRGFGALRCVKSDITGAFLSRPETEVERESGMVSSRCWKVLAFLDEPIHLVMCTCVAIVRIDIRFRRQMFFSVEEWTAAYTVVSSTLALSDRVCCSATAFKTLDDSTADNSRPPMIDVSLDMERVFGGTDAYDGLTAIRPWSSTKFLILL